MRIALLRYAACFLLVLCAAACERQPESTVSIGAVRAEYPLHFAVLDQDVAKARALLEAGADPNQAVALGEEAVSSAREIGLFDGDQPVEIAVRKGDTGIVTLLSAHGADLSVREEQYEGDSLLHIAAFADDPAMVKCLIDQGMEPDIGLPAPGANQPPAVEGRTPLMTAASFDNLAAMRALLENGADVNARTATNQTAMHAVASVTKPEAAKLLLEYGAEIDPFEDQWGGTPLHYAADHGKRHTGTNEGRADMVRLLVKAGADINKRDAKGRTPLYRAVGTRCSETTEVLLQLGADPAIPDNEGMSPKEFAELQPAIWPEISRLVKKYSQEGEE